MNTKGIELVISNMVILILVTVTFIGAITLTFRFFKGAEDIGRLIDKETQQALEQRLLSPNDIVAFHPTRMTTTWNKPAKFGMGIRNLGQQGTFSVKVEFDRAYDIREQPVQNTDKEYIEREWLGNFAEFPLFQIKANEVSYQGIFIIPKGTIASNTPSPRATYVFNVCIYKKSTPDAPCQLTQDRTQLDAFYDKQIHQVSIST